MASSDVPAARRDGGIPLPWLLMGAGLLLCLLALGLTRTLESEPAAPRLLILTAGLLAAGTAVAVRLSRGGPAYVDRILGPSRSTLLLALAGLFAGLAAAAVVIFTLTFVPTVWMPWTTGTAAVLATVVVPLGLGAAGRAAQLSRQGRSVSAGEEAAVLLLLAALCTFIACWALYLPDDPGSWDTIRLFLAVLTAAALLAAPLALASVRIRRWTISVLVVLHFGGIAAATLSAPPTPWLMGQLWTRVYRPYLEFMYLNNAYHFYAPEPGAASFLWCRLVYVDAGGKEVGDWFKVPNVDVRGFHQHSTALEYQRYLALVENLVHSDPTPSFFIITAERGQEIAPFFQLRQMNSPQPIRVGQPTPALAVPFHPFVAVAQQYSLPNASTRRLLASYVRHVARTHATHPDLPGAALRSVKVYRVRHEIAPVDPYAKMDPPMSPNDPELYRPYYLGTYDAEGRLLDGPVYDAQGQLVRPGDPFLYWLLPVLRDDTTNIHSPIRDYCRKHAGDPNWIRLPDSDTWVDTDRALIELGKRQ